MCLVSFAMRGNRNLTRDVVPLVLAGLTGLPLVAQDWPMWGGTAERT